METGSRSLAALALGNLALLSPRPAVSIGACRPLGTAGPLQPCSRGLPQAGCCAPRSESRLASGPF